MKYFSILLCSILLGVLIVTGCGDDPQKKGPRQTAEAFLAALQNSDYARAKEFCTPGTRGNLTMFETFSGMGANPFAEEFNILREEISDDYARVFYTQGEDEKEKFVRLRKEDGRWEVIANKSDLSPKDEKEDEENGMDLLDDDDETDKDVKHANKNRSLREGKSPEEIADDFLTAMMFGDYEKAKKLASKSSEMAITMQKDKGGQSMEGFTIIRSKQKDEYATVYYKEKGEDLEKELKLTKDPNGNWQVVMSKSDSPSEVE